MKNSIAQHQANIGQDTDLQKEINNIRNNALSIYEFAYKRIKNNQKKLDSFVFNIEESVKKKGIAGQITNALLIRPVIRLIKSFVSLDPNQLADQVVDNTLLSFYDLLDNFNLIPEGNNIIQLLSNTYDWLQVIVDLRPILKKEADPYSYIEAATDFIYAAKESQIAGQIPSLDVFNASIMSAYLMSKIAAPAVRYKGDPRSGLKILGLELEKNENKITELFQNYFDNINKEINNAILNGNTKSYEVLNELAKKFSWVKAFSEKSNLTANELYLMEETKDIIINKLKLYNIVLLNFNKLKGINFKWTPIKFLSNWNSLPQHDKEFVNSLVEKFKKQNINLI